MVKVCFVPLLEQGHIAMCAAIGKYLLTRDPNNEVLFITDEEFEPAIKRHCCQFQTLLYKQPVGAQERVMAKRNNKFDVWKKPPKELYAIMTEGFIAVLELWIERQHVVRELVKSIENLDFIFVENLFNLPFLQNLDIKWGMVICTNPLRIADQVNYPPMSTGVFNLEEAKEYLEISEASSAKFCRALDEWYQQYGLLRKPSLSYVEGSDYLNVYLFPKPLNYFEPNEISGKWVQLNSTILKDEVKMFIQSRKWVTEKAAGKELLTPEFLAKPGHLIAFSMGTFVTRTVAVFEEQLKILKDIPHKFIVSKGKFGDQFDLPDNCVGAGNIDLLEILPLVDVFVTHGGNNSFTEAFYFGTPMVAIPVFSDQQLVDTFLSFSFNVNLLIRSHFFLNSTQYSDNACRLEQMNLGKRLNFANLTKETLTSAIDYVVNNDEIRKKMAEISEFIRNDKDGLDEVCDLIYELCTKKN